MTKPTPPKKRNKKKKPTINNGFIYEADLTGCKEFIELNYSAPTQPLFRWVHSPVEEGDFIPQYYLKDKEPKIHNFEMEPSIEERVERNTTSMYISEMASKKAYKGAIERLETRDMDEGNDPDIGHKAQFMQRCAPYMGRYILTEKDAVVGKPNKKGHVNVILKRGFDYKKNLDPTYGIKYMLDDDEEFKKNK